MYKAEFQILTTQKAAVTLRNIRKAERGQAAIEYLLVMVALVMFFTGMYAFLQGQVVRLFKAAGIKILTSYQ